MGLFLCNMCNEQLGTEKHTCEVDKIQRYVEKLKLEASMAEHHLREIQNSVFMLLQDLPSIDGEEVSVRSDWLKKIWKAAECQWYRAKDPETFLILWLALHRILCEAFDVFRLEKYGKKENLVEKLSSLKEACVSAAKVFNYEDSNLGLTPEKLVNT